ncbi:PilX N-terminal [Desulforamulus putei DSM 12395]|uniref:PilX N-terminal n=1 Tax=Desulforamulus putei DSM 12395 TaxID=1121429 RepID=A0A1M4UXV5_9FIRM|nr:pilus assembly PilX N-terminal domain-containing protein [Desulforamulus putei]SHE61499.1 PilX N-terminal [Desulforamulus putei DSM 12395]
MGVWRDQRGIALPMVLVFITVFTLLGFTAAYLVTSQTTLGSRYAGSQDALHYAEAGCQNYLWHLNEGTPNNVEFNKDIKFTDGYYRLQLINTGQQTVTLRATGWPAADPTNKRTIETRFRKRQFNQHVYLSHDDGSDIWWADGEKCYGPLHTNTDLRIQGRPVFYGKVTYSNQLIKGTKYNPDFRAGPPQKVAGLVFPASNNQLKLLARQGGYYYEGRTCIMLLGSGQIVTRNAKRAGDDGKLDSPETRPLPANGVIYVDGTTGNDQYSINKFDLSRGNAFISGTLKGQLTVGAANDIYITGKDPTNYDYKKAAATGGVRYAATTFTPVYQNSEQVGWTVSGNDMLGLVANNNVWILGQYWFTGSVTDVAPYDIAIQGVVFAINKGFGYETYDLYDKGTINLIGSLIQHQRLPVGLVGQTGYSKNYSFDPRMNYQTPPHFLEPSEAGWEVDYWQEVANP